MLSAIAARRARLHLTNPNSDKGQTPPDKTPTPSPSPPPSPPLLQTIPKRRPASNSQTINPRKKKKKVAHVVEKKRYFEVQDIDIGEGDNGPVIHEDESSSGEDGNIDVTHTTLEPVILLNDTSDEASDAGVEPYVPDSPVDTIPQAIPDTQRRVLSTFGPVLGTNTFRISADDLSQLNLSISVSDNPTLVVLDPSQTIALLGVYGFVVVQGSVSVFGVTVSASRTSHRVFAPRSSPVPVLRSLSRDKGTSELSFLPHRFCSLSGHAGALIILHEVKTGVQGLGWICRIFDGIFDPSRSQKLDSESPALLQDVHLLTHKSRDIQPFELLPSWERALSTVLSSRQNELTSPDPAIFLVKGPKKSGKSTFARTLLNCLSTRYRRVAFLECDLGQSEFTPAGMVALNIIENPIFGPPFTHPTIPNFAHYIGTTSPRSSPSHYISAIQALLQLYRLDIQSPALDAGGVESDDRVMDTIPLVVNTMGWTKGLGADLSRSIEELVQPTAIFEIKSLISKPSWSAATVPRSSDHCTVNHSELHLLEPIPPSVLSTNYSAADHRVLSILSYFHAVFPTASLQPLQQVSAVSWNTSLPLCAQPPYEVDWTLAIDKFILTGAGMEDVVPSEIKRVLNGAVVGLVGCDLGTIDVQDPSPSSSDPPIPYAQGSSPPSPSSSSCLGLALIRAISPTSTRMHILTPLPPGLLGKCRVVVKGELELPIWGMLDFRAMRRDGSSEVVGTEKTGVPYLQWGKREGLGADRRRVRRNLMRRGQM